MAESKKEKGSRKRKPNNVPGSGKRKKEEKTNKKTHQYLKSSFRPLVIMT